jgi:hypothetical protein
MKICEVKSFDNQRKDGKVNFRARMQKETISKLYDIAATGNPIDRTKLYVLLERLNEFPSGYVNFNAKDFDCGGVLVSRKSIFGKTRFSSVDRFMSVVDRTDKENPKTVLSSTQKHAKGGLIEFLENILVDNGAKLDIKTSTNSLPKLSIQEYNHRCANLLDADQSFTRKNFLKFSF